MFSDGIENLLIDQVRVSFRDDTLKLQSINQNKDQVRAKARAKESKLNDGASSRLVKLQACLDRFGADFDDVSAKIKVRDEDQKNLRELTDRGSAGHWSDSAMAAAKSDADDQLSGSAQKIAQSEQQIESLLKNRDQLFQDGQSLATKKNELEELLSLLTSGSKPKEFQDALTEEMSGFNSAFQTSSDDINRALAEELKQCSVSENELSSLSEEIEDARIRAADSASARNLGWLARRLDPRNLVWRREDVIQRDIDTQQDRLQKARVAHTAYETELAELRVSHEEQIATLPDTVRRRLIEEARYDLNESSSSIREIERMAKEVAASLNKQQSDVALQKAHYTDAHRRALEVHFNDLFDCMQRDLENIENEIITARDRQMQLEQHRARLMALIENRRERLEEALLECKRQESNQLDQLEHEAYRLKLRLKDRARRAGMIHDPVTNAFRENEAFPGLDQNRRATYRQTGDQPSAMITLPLLLQRRVQTGYAGKDDERLAAVLASICDENGPGEDERAALIDHFCDIVFGDDQEERPFFISIISKTDESLFVLVRPAQVLPQLKGRLPDAMSACVLCRLEYNAKRTPDNTALFILDAALVPDCGPRPFEMTISLVRHSSRTSLPVVTSPLDQILEQANVSLPTLMYELQDRLNDWQGYLGWANGEILRRTPWAALGSGKLTNDTWEGEVFCEDKNDLRSISGAGRRGDARQSLEVYLLKDVWQRMGREDNAGVYRCIDYKVISPAEPQAFASQDCPWPNSFPCRVSMKFSRRDASALADLPDGTPLGLRDMTEAIGSQVQLFRYRNALTQLQLGATENRQSNRLPAAPYLMASLFNVTQAARPTAKRGSLLNQQIAKLYRLNEDQGAAVEVMLASPEIAYIQGPPGTGKTTMIAAACAHFVRSGQRILIASQTNLAVENALERLIGDPEVRPLWLSKNDGEQKKSAAIADWYRMAAGHVERAVCNPYQTLTDEVGHLENWLERARRLDLNGGRAALDLQKREDDLRRSEARLDEVQRLQNASSEARARAVWWAMAHEALATLAEWDPSCFSDGLAPDTTDLLKLLAKFDGNGAPRLDVSPTARHRQTQKRIQDIQNRLSSDDVRSKDAERIRRQILDAWPNVTVPSLECLDGEKPFSLTPAQAEAAVLRARQSFEDAQSRADEIHVKIQTLLSEIGGTMNVPEVPTDLASAIDVVERHADLQGIRLDDIEPLGEWLPLLDRWVIDLKQQAENPPATDRMGKRYVRNANVIGVTCNSDFKILSDSGFPRFDVVIIDEVSKATPLELLRPMLLAPKTILVGDHRQLPPTFEFASFGSSDKSPTEDEDQDALEREAELLSKYERLTTASLFRDGFAEIDAEARAALQTQYRMHPQIMSLVNRFYDGRLESGLIDPDGSDDTASWSWRTHGLSLNSRTGGQYLVPHLHALWIDSSKDEAGRPAYEDSDGTGIGNKLEARLVAQMVEDILDGCEREQRKKTIAVATFYNRQKRLIRKALEEKLGRRFNDLQIDVETVDRFQGKEADIVIVSMVRNRSRRLGSNSNPAKFERINVAFSRARDLLIVVGARKTFERFDVAIEPVDGGAPQRICVYGQIIDDIKDIGGLWQAKDILGESSPRSGDRSA